MLYEKLGLKYCELIFPIMITWNLRETIIIWNLAIVLLLQLSGKWVVQFLNGLTDEWVRGLGHYPELESKSLAQT